MEKVKTKIDILSNSSREKHALNTTSSKKHEGFVLYAPANTICDIVSVLGEVYILEYKDNRFPAHKSKLEILTL